MFPSLATPALLLDLGVAERNLEAMAARAGALGVALRPHAKTHKCVELAERQRTLGARGLTVSTLDEAEVFAEAGFDDITWAFPVAPAEATLGRVERLAERVRLGLLVDSLEALEALERLGRRLAVWIKVDCGYHRAGVDPHGELLLELGRRLAVSPVLQPAGVLTHSGHAYAARGREVLARVAEEERSVMVAAAARLRAADVPVPGVSVGSTPAMMAVDSLEGVTEARPGNYVFHDLSQVTRGAASMDDIGVSVLTTVVSCQPGARHSVVDAGALALSKDAGCGDTGMGLALDVTDRPAGTLVSLSQEHGILDRPWPVGTRLRILPNHSCLTVACFDAYDVIRDGRLTGRWGVRRVRG